MKNTTKPKIMILLGDSGEGNPDHILMVSTDRVCIMNEARCHLREKDEEFAELPDDVTWEQMDAEVAKIYEGLSLDDILEIVELEDGVKLWCELRGDLVPRNDNDAEGNDEP